MCFRYIELPLVIFLSHNNVYISPLITDVKLCQVIIVNELMASKWSSPIQVITSHLQYDSLNCIMVI